MLYTISPGSAIPAGLDVGGGGAKEVPGGADRAGAGALLAVPASAGRRPRVSCWCSPPGGGRAGGGRPRRGVRAGGWPPGHVRLGELERHLGEGVIENLVEAGVAAGRIPAPQRQRLMSLALTIRMTVAMTLMPGASLYR